jgi:hypothetical protein
VAVEGINLRLCVFEHLVILIEHRCTLIDEANEGFIIYLLTLSREISECVHNILSIKLRRLDLEVITHHQELTNADMCQLISESIKCTIHCTLINLLLTIEFEYLLECFPHYLLGLQLHRLTLC